MKINEVTKKIEPSKPRNFVAKNAMSTTSGAGAHRDKKKELKQGKEKHKGKDLAKELDEGTPVNVNALMSRADRSGSSGPWWAKAGDINHMTPSGKVKPMRYKLYFKDMFAKGMDPKEVIHHATQLGMQRDDKDRFYLPVYTLNDATKATITRAKFYFGDDPIKVTVNNDEISEEGENIAGTITSVTPDGKQVTMKKPDGTEVTTDASAFLPGPNNTVTINQPSPGDALKPGTVVQAAPQGMGEEINDEEDPDLMGSGHNHDIGGDATDEFIDDVRDKEFEKHNAFGALGRIKQLAGVKETSQPENVVDPEEPADQEVPAQEPAQQAPAEPVRKPRYQWQAMQPGGDIKSHIAAQQAAMAQHAGVAAKDFDTTIDEFPNPAFDPNGTDDENDPSYEPELLSIGVDYEYSYHGKYYAATYYDPAEYPELEIRINRVVDLENGEDITKKVDLSAVEQYIEDEIPSWEDEEREARDQAAIDRYEANRDYYDESMDRIRKLSGL